MAEQLEKNDPRRNFVEQQQKSLAAAQNDVKALLDQASSIAEKMRLLKFKIDRPLPSIDPKGEGRLQRKAYIKELGEAAEALRVLKDKFEERVVAFEFVADNVKRMVPDRSHMFRSKDEYLNTAAGIINRADSVLYIGNSLGTGATGTSGAKGTSGALEPATGAAVDTSTASSVVVSTPAARRTVIPLVAEEPMYTVKLNMTIPSISLGFLHLLHTIQGLLNDPAGTQPIPRPIANPAHAFAALYKIAKGGSLESAEADDNTLLTIQEQLDGASMSVHPLVPIATHHVGFKNTLKALRYANAVEYVDLARLDNCAFNAAAEADASGNPTFAATMVVDSDRTTIQDMDVITDPRVAAYSLLNSGIVTAQVAISNAVEHFESEKYFEATKLTMSRPAVLMGYASVSSLRFARSLTAPQIGSLQQNALNIAGSRYRCVGLLLQPVGGDYADMNSVRFTGSTDVKAQKMLELVRLRYMDHFRMDAPLKEVLDVVDAAIADVEAQLKGAGVPV